MHVLDGASIIAIRHPADWARLSTGSSTGTKPAVDVAALRWDATLSEDGNIVTLLGDSADNRDSGGSGGSGGRGGRGGQSRGTPRDSRRSGLGPLSAPPTRSWLMRSTRAEADPTRYRSLALTPLPTGTW